MVLKICLIIFRENISKLLERKKSDRNDHPYIKIIPGTFTEVAATPRQEDVIVGTEPTSFIIGIRYNKDTVVLISATFPPSFSLTSCDQAANTVTTATMPPAPCFRSPFSCLGGATCSRAAGAASTAGAVISVVTGVPFVFLVAAASFLACFAASAWSFLFAAASSFVTLGGGATGSSCASSTAALLLLLFLAAAASSLAFLLSPAFAFLSAATFSLSLFLTAAASSRACFAASAFAFFSAAACSFA